MYSDCQRSVDLLCADFIQGCVSHFESELHYILIAVAGVCIAAGVLQVNNMHEAACIHDKGRVTHDRLFGPNSCSDTEIVHIVHAEQNYHSITLLWARSSIAHMYGWPRNKMAAPINVLAFKR